MSSKQFVYKDNYYINTASEGTVTTWSIDFDSLIY